MMQLARVYELSTRRSAGFTLIEIMITVTIVAILASISLPAYQRYVIRARASESLVLATNAKNMIVECQATGTAMADMNSGTGPFPPGNLTSTEWVAGVFVVQGVVRIRYAAAAPAGLAGQDLVLTPNFGPSKTEWRCGFTDTGGYAYVPANCRQPP